MKVLVLVSGGIDSPVAAYMMASVGAELLALHMDPSPYSEPRERVSRLVERLRRATGQSIPLLECPHGQVNLKALETLRDRHIRCVLCKRFMLRVAEAVAEREGCGALVTGDSLGQVASQTLANMRAEGDAVKMPVLRPLIGMDTEEIIWTAKEIGTFELSTEGTGTCTFAPSKPSTRAKLDRVRAGEALVDVKGLVETCLSEVRRL
jgi:thiamine biosynthesis protein ThiI